MAAAILAPMNLGGAEVVTGGRSGRGAVGNSTMRVGDASDRLVRFTVLVFPAYAGLTVLLWILLIIAGEDGLGALMRAMGITSRSARSSTCSANCRRSNARPADRWRPCSRGWNWRACA